MSARATIIAAVAVVVAPLVIVAALGVQEASSAAPTVLPLQMDGGFQFTVKGYPNVGIGGMLLHGVETTSKGSFWKAWEVSYLGTDAAGTRHISLRTSGIDDKESEITRCVVPAGQTKAVTLFAFPGLKRPVRVVASLSEGKDGTISATVVSASVVEREVNDTQE